MLHKWTLLIALSLLLTACSGNKTLAPVSDISKPPPQYEGTHVVLRGETLYTISWRYGRDFRELASINNIQSPYTIYPGQKIELAGDAAPAQPISSAAISSEPKWTTISSNVASTPTPSATPATQQTSTPIAVVPVVSTQGKGTWLWPSNGKVERGYSSQNNGLDIVAAEGSPVVATAAGEVVYSGSGLRGYGQLIIIKHDERYLSAYAHNRVLLVKEGDKVKAGQEIAEMGKSGTDTVKLHFEVRQEGKPVDPLLFLAKKE